MKFLAALGIVLSSLVLIASLNVALSQFGGEAAQEKAVDNCVKSTYQGPNFELTKAAVIQCRENYPIERFTWDPADVFLLIVLGIPFIGGPVFIIGICITYLQEISPSRQITYQSKYKKDPIKTDKNSELFPDAPLPGKQEAGKADFDGILHELILDLRKARKEKKLPPKKAYQTAAFLSKKLFEEDGYYSKSRMELWSDVADYLETHLKKVYKGNPELIEKRRLL